MDRTSYFSIPTKIIATALVYLTIMQPPMLNAQTITPVLPTAGSRPVLDQTKSGIDLINIAPPSGGGVSRNVFTDFNVSEKGIIFNNSATNTTTKIGGWVEGNPNLSPGNSASIILNEVIGPNQSQLKGFMEVAGPKADVVVANPNGVTCNGCGFINTGRATLTTGTATMQDGNLAGFSVERGTVRIEGKGLNANEADRLDIISRAQEIHGDIVARDLKTVTGANDVSYGDVPAATRKASGEPAPVVAVDVSAMGGMYANSIQMIATDDGVGVRNDGNIMSVEDLMMTATGSIENSGTILSEENVKIGANIVENREGLIWAGKSVEIDNGDGGKAERVSNRQGRIQAAGGDVTVRAGLIENVSTAPTFTPKGYSRTWYETASSRINQPVSRFKGMIDPAVLDSAGNIRPEHAAAYAKLMEAMLSGGQPPADALALVKSSALSGGQVSGGTADFWGDAGTRSGMGSNIGVAVRDLLKADVRQGSGVKPQYAEAYAKLWEQLLEGGKFSADVLDIIEADVVDGDLLKTDYRTPWIKLTAPSGPGYTVRKTLVADVLHDDGKLAEILASGDINFEANSVRNIYGVISAGGNITIDAASLENRAYAATATLFEVHKKACFSCHEGRLSYGDSFGGLIQAHNAIDINVINMANVTDGTRPGANDLPAVHEMHNDRPGIKPGAEEAVPTSQLEVARTGLTREQLEAVFDVGPFAEASPESPYVVETRPEFATGDAFLGSQYLMDRLGYDVDNPDSTPRFMGDAWFDARSLKSQIVAKTGHSHLFEGISDDYEEIKKLFENGAIAGATLGLKLGNPLTPQQIAALDQPIAWMEKRVVDGEIVYVPQLYLSGSDEVVIHEGGALIAGRSVDINAITTIVNDGSIDGEEDVKVASLMDVVNLGNIKAGGRADITAGASVRNNGGNIQAGGVDIDAGQDVYFAGGSLKSGGDARVTANGDVVFDDIRQYSEGKRGQGTYSNSRSIETEIETGGDFTVAAGRDAKFTATDAFVGGDLDVSAGRHIVIEAAAEHVSYEYHTRKKGGFFGGGKKTDHYENHITHNRANLTAGGNVNLTAGSNLRLTGSELHAAGEMEVTAGDKLIVEHVMDSSTVQHSVQKTGAFGGFFGGNSSKSEYHHKTTVNGSAVVSGRDLITNSGDDTILQASTFQSGSHLTINVGVGPKAQETARLFLKTAKEVEELDVQSYDSNFVRWKMRNYGFMKETVKHALLFAGDGFTINAPGGIVIEYRDNGNFNDSINQLSKMPGLEYLAEMRQRDDVDWVAIQEAYEEWDYKAQGISGGLAALIAIAVAWAMPSLGPGLLAVIGEAALTTLITTATTTLIGSGGDLGEVFKTLGSMDFVRQLGTSILTAGLMHGIGQLLPQDSFSTALGLDKTDFMFDAVNLAQKQLLGFIVKTTVKSTVGGQSFNKAAVAELRNAAVSLGTGVLQQAVGEVAGNIGLEDGDLLKVISHAAIGGLAAEASGGEFLDGAVAGAAAEIASGFLKGNETLSLETQQFLAELVGALAATISSGGMNGQATSMGGDIASSAFHNNRMLHTKEIKAIEEKAKELAEKDKEDEEKAKTDDAAREEAQNSGRIYRTEEQWVKILGQAAYARVDEFATAEIGAYLTNKDFEDANLVLNQLIVENKDFNIYFLGEQIKFLQATAKSYTDSTLLIDHTISNNNFYETILDDWKGVSYKGLIENNDKYNDFLEYEKDKLLLGEEKFQSLKEELPASLVLSIEAIRSQNSSKYNTENYNSLSGEEKNALTVNLFKELNAIKYLERSLSRKAQNLFLSGDEESREISAILNSYREESLLDTLKKVSLSIESLAKEHKEYDVIGKLLEFPGDFISSTGEGIIDLTDFGFKAAISPFSEEAWLEVQSRYDAIVTLTGSPELIIQGLKDNLNKAASLEEEANSIYGTDPDLALKKYSEAQDLRSRVVTEASFAVAENFIPISKIKTIGNLGKVDDIIGFFADHRFPANLGSHNLLPSIKSTPLANRGYKYDLITNEEIKKINLGVDDGAKCLTNCAHATSALILTLRNRIKNPTAGVITAEVSKSMNRTGDIFENLEFTIPRPVENKNDLLKFIRGMEDSAKDNNTKWFAVNAFPLENGKGHSFMAHVTDEKVRFIDPQTASALDMREFVGRVQYSPVSLSEP